MGIESYIGGGFLTIIGCLSYLVLKEWVSRSSKLFIDKKNRRIGAINNFRQVFIEEREKIKAFDIQNNPLQERAVFEIRRYITFWQIFRLKRIWADYQKAENKHRQVDHTQDVPPNHLIYYGDHKNEVLHKIDKIIKYLKSLLSG